MEEVKGNPRSRSSSINDSCNIDDIEVSGTNNALAAVN